MTRAERIIDIVKKVDSPWVGINLDTGNFHELDWALRRHNNNLRPVAGQLRSRFGVLNAGLAETITGIEVVKGFAPVMPPYKGLIKDAEISALIEYIKTLK